MSAPDESRLLISCGPEPDEWIESKRQIRAFRDFLTPGGESIAICFAVAPGLSARKCLSIDETEALIDELTRAVGGA